MTENRSETRQSSSLIGVGLVLVVLGALMTRGSLGPFVGVIVAMLGIGLVVAWLVRKGH